MVTIDCAVSDYLTVNLQPKVPPAGPPCQTSTCRHQAELSTTHVQAAVVLLPPPPLPVVDEEPLPQSGSVILSSHHSHICSTYILAALPTPIPNNPSNPFRIRTNEDHACPGHEAGRETRSSTPTSRSGESFAQASPSSSMGQTPPQRSRGTPCVGRHSTVPSTINRSRPAATGGTCASPKRKKGARDVWTFFEEMKDRCFCVFCKWVIYLCTEEHLLILYHHRHIHSVDASHVVFPFSVTSGPSTLCAHLFTHHLELWVKGCDKFKIPIVAEKAKGPVANYHASKGDGSQATSAEFAGDRPPDIQEYSYEAFVDAITKFIIADNQVCSIYINPRPL